MTETAWQVFQLEELIDKVHGDQPRFLEFLRVPALSAAIYRLPAGSRDMQAPHLEDEIYFVAQGRARLRVGGHEYEVRRGTILFVQASEPHSFYDVEEDLCLLTFFGSAGSPWDR